MNISNSIATAEQLDITLREKRLQLILRLQLNRRLLTCKFATPTGEASFPRSMLMRFLTKKETASILKKGSYSLLGAVTLKALYATFSFMHRARKKLTANKT